MALMFEYIEYKVYMCFCAEWTDTQIDPKHAYTHIDRYNMMKQCEREEKK